MKSGKEASKPDLVSKAKPIIHDQQIDKTHIKVGTLSGERQDSGSHKLPSCHSEKHNCKEEKDSWDMSRGWIALAKEEFFFFNGHTLKKFSSIARHYLPLDSLQEHGHSNGWTPHTYPKCKKKKTLFMLSTKKGRKKKRYPFVQVFLVQMPRRPMKWFHVS